MKIAIIDTLGLCYDGNTLNNRGLGGSESAVILMSRELHQVGFSVTVFNDCTSDGCQPGTYDGVLYRPLKDVETVNDAFDIVIGSRSVAAFAPKHLSNQFKSFTGPLPDFTRMMSMARWKVLWLHDTFCDGDQYVEPFVLDNFIDEIFTLSDWHTNYVLTCQHGRKRMYEALKQRTFITRNGINKHIDWVDIQSKDPNLFVYNASVSKGMVPLVAKVWPLVKQQIPDARLKVIGGYYKFRDDSPPDEQQQIYEQLVSQYDNTLDIEFTGVISQQQVATILSAASFTIYPGAFPETFGISTLESLAYNTPVITCRFGAMEETAIDIACYKIEYPVEPNALFPEINTDDQVLKFVNLVVQAHSNKYLHQQKMYACNQVQNISGWDMVAIQWKQHFFRKLGEFLPVDDYISASHINHRVREVFGRRTINTDEYYVPRANVQRHLVVIVPLYNAEKYVDLCIRSIATQDYNNYTVYIIDDASTDGSYNQIANTLQQLPTDIASRFVVIKNDTNMGAMYNQVNTIRRYCEDTDVVMLIDGDDWLVNDPNIFHKFNNIYDEGAKFTYGSCWSLADNIPLISQPYPPEIKARRAYREYKFSWNMPYTHMRTFSAFLIKLVDDDNFKDQHGQWYRAGGDGALFYSLIEVCDPNTVVCLPDIVYNYNDMNPINDYKVNADEQTAAANAILTRRLTTPSNEVSKMKKILIAIPTARYVECDTFKSIYDLEIPDGYETTFQCFYGYSVDQVRNLIADWTVKGFDYLFSVDHDITFAPDTLKKLLSHDKPVVSGVYRQRLEPQCIEIYDHQMRHLDFNSICNLPLVEVGGCGFGCVLVKSQAFANVGYPQFVYHSALNHADTFSEDLDFCKKARQLGHTIWVDPTIMCGHIGQSTFNVTASVPVIDPVKNRLRELHNQSLLPTSHVDYLHNMKQHGIQPKVIYDLGACVLHWTNRAKEVWPDADYTVFDAMPDAAFLYEEAGLRNYIGVVTDVDGKQVDFYQNVEHPGGNSLYKENPLLSPQAEQLFPENSKIRQTGYSLDTIVRERNLPLPDLIKMDVQGAELEILKGAANTLKKCRHLILELQHKDYNFGAPKVEEVIKYLKTIGFELASDGMFCGSELGVDGDYHFVRTGRKVDKAYIIRTADPRSMEYAALCAETCTRYNVPWEYWEAHDNKTAHELWHDDTTISNFQLTMIPPAASCTATHFDIWKHAVATDQCVIILEHDAIVLDEMDFFVPDGIILTLGYKLTDRSRYYDLSARHEDHQIIYVPSHYGSHAYAITPDTAAVLLLELKISGVPVSIDASHFIRDDVRYSSRVPLAIYSPTPVICWLRESTIWSDGAQEINAPFIDSFAAHLRDSKDPQELYSDMRVLRVEDMSRALP